MLPGTLITAGKTDIAADNGTLEIIIVAIEAAYRNHLLGHLQAVDFDQHAGKLTISWRHEDLSPLAEDTETNFSIGQLVLFKQVMTMADLGVTGLQELQSRGNRAEEVTHGHGGAIVITCLNSTRWPILKFVSVSSARGDRSS